MTGCLREGRGGCCFSFVFKIMASMVTVKQSFRYSEREAGLSPGRAFQAEELQCKGPVVGVYLRNGRKASGNRGMSLG